MPRFFVPNEDVGEEHIILRADDARHIARSLRMAVGDTLCVCDRDGREYTCHLTYIRNDEVHAAIDARCDRSTELPVQVTLYMAYPKGDKLETVIQKAVELGACRIIPFVSSRCIKVPKAERETAQRARLVRIAQEAAKQCGRTRLPEVGETISFDVMLRQVRDYDLPLFCYEGEHTCSIKSALQAHPHASRLCVTVGCEGGFSPEEAASAREAGFVCVHLGPRILRCETAPSYVLSAIAYHTELEG